MSNTENLQLFENQPIRTAWYENEEEWYFSIVDVVGVLTDQPTPRNATYYWGKLKQRLKEEGANELLTNCQQLNLAVVQMIEALYNKINLSMRRRNKHEC